MRARGVRPWCARARYPGLREFRFGTVVIDAAAQAPEIDAALRAAALDVLPPGFEIVGHEAGSVFFAPDPGD